MLLSDEEIEKLEEDCPDCHGHNEKLVAKAQLKKVVGWLDEHQMAEIVKGRLCWCLRDADLHSLLKETDE